MGIRMMRVIPLVSALGLVLQLHGCATVPAPPPEPPPAVVEEPPPPPVVEPPPPPPPPPPAGPARIEVLHADFEAFPTLVIEFQVFAEEERPVTGLRLADLVWESDARPPSEAPWGQTPAANLRRYHSSAAADGSGALALADESPGLYRLTAWDGDWGVSEARRYRLIFEAAGFEYEFEWRYAPEADRLLALRSAEWDAAFEAVTGLNEPESVINALLGRYSRQALTPWFERLADHAARGAGLERLAWSLRILRGLEENEAQRPGWTERLAQAWSTLSERLESAGRLREAIGALQSAAAHDPTERRWLTLFDLHRRILDFQGALRALERLGDLETRLRDDEELFWSFARTAASDLQWLAYERVTAPAFASLSRGEEAWSDLTLVWKGRWYSLAARLIAESLDRPGASSLSLQDACAELLGMNDVLWVAVVDGQGRLLERIGDAPEIQRAQEWDASLRHFDPSETRRAFQVHASQGGRTLAALYVPMPRRGGGLMLAYEDRVYALDEQRGLVAFQNAPAVASAKREIQRMIANRCGGAMARTLGRLLELRPVSPAEWAGAGRSFDAFEYAESLRYRIVAGRQAPNAPVEVLWASPDYLPAEIVRDERANQTPHFWFTLREGEEEVYELGVGVYANANWLGSLRLGFAAH